MAVNIKNREVEELATEVARLAGESKTQAVKQALLERRARLGLHGTRRDGGERFREYLEREVWPHLPPTVKAQRLSREEEDALLGYGSGGV